MTNNDHDTAAVFDAHAPEYDALRRRLIPCYDALYGAAADLAAHIGPLRHVLDLGAGTGLLCGLIADRCPTARFHLLDGGPRMLAQAQARLGDRIAALHVADLADPLPTGPFCAVVSALAIHHLVAADQERLAHRAFAALTPGGIFVNAEQVAGPTPALDARYRAAHEHQARALGTTDAEWAAARERMSHDRCLPVGVQLRWLREAGFADVDCVFRDGRFAVLTGRRPASVRPASGR